jgi:hypothetical protein
LLFGEPHSIASSGGKGIARERGKKIRIKSLKILDSYPKEQAITGGRITGGGGTDNWSSAGPK